MGASAIKCWQNDTKTLQCIKLQPWSFKRAEFWHRTGASLPLAVLVLAALLVLVLVVTTLTPFTTAMALRRLWVVFPLGFLLHRGLRRAFIGRWRPELAPQEITYVSHVFVIACLAHSVLIFFPNHAPHDLWNHLPQVEWLSELPLDFDSIYRYSTSSDPFDDGHVRPHFGVEYGAPYPPFFYVLTLAATKLHGDARFLIEFLSVLVIAAMTVPLFLLARTVFHDPRIAQLAVLLFVLEISAWHHAHRVHGPGTMGALLVLVWMVYLTAYHDSLYERAHLWIFAVLSATAALSYAASLVQLCIFAAVLLLLLWIGGPRSYTKTLGCDKRGSRTFSFKKCVERGGSTIDQEFNPAVIVDKFVERSDDAGRIVVRHRRCLGDQHAVLFIIEYHEICERAANIYPDFEGALFSHGYNILLVVQNYVAWSLGTTYRLSKTEDNASHFGRHSSYRLRRY